MKADIFLVIITAVAVSYGWGMRGAVIGGEKGAMLPGALLGMFLALFSGYDALSANFYIFAAAGCIGMAYGGFEPYAQTMDYILSRDEKLHNPRKGYAGLCLKGANWFGIGAGILGMSFSAATGSIYKWYDFVIFFALVPLIQALGVRIFNHPFNKSAGLFPRMYFSRTSREEWGGNLLMLLSILLMTSLRGDTFALMFCLTGIVAGAAGWSLSIFLFDVTGHPLKNGKYIFGRLQKSGYIDNWKLMEFTLGAVGGIALSLYFVLADSQVSKIAQSVAQNGIWSPIGNCGNFSNSPNFSNFGNCGEFLAWLSLALILAATLQNMYADLKKRNNGNAAITSRLFELIERPLFFAVPGALVMLGSMREARLVTFVIVLWVLCEKNIFDRIELKRGKTAFDVMHLVAVAAAIVGEVLLPDGYSPVAIVLMYTAIYIVSDMLYYLIGSAAENRRNKYPDRAQRRKSFGSLYSVHGFFWIQSAVLIIAVATVAR